MSVETQNVNTPSICSVMNSSNCIRIDIKQKTIQYFIVKGAKMVKNKILFLCSHNAVRSQIAEGLLRHYYGQNYEVFSAGTTPTQVHPLAAKVMAEIGIDISGQSSKSIEVFKEANIDLAVSVCQSSAKIVCPLCSSPLVMARPELIDSRLPNAKRYVVHGFSDPSEVEGTLEEKVAAFQRTRDEIREWINNQFANLEIDKVN